MAGLINSNILRNPSTRKGLGGAAFADQAMNFAPQLPQVAGGSRYPGAAIDQSMNPQTPRFGSQGVATQPQISTPKPVPFSGQVAGTSQALTAAPEPIDLGDYYAPGGDDRAAAASAPKAPAPYDPSNPYDPRGAGPGVLDYDEQGRIIHHPYPSDWVASGSPDEQAQRQDDIDASLAWQGARGNFDGFTRPTPTPAPDWVGIAGRGVGGFGQKPSGGTWGTGGAWQTKGTPEGSLQNPGTGESTTDETLGQVKDKGDAATQAITDQIMATGGLEPRDFDQFYDNAWKHSSADINSEYAGRGMGNSSDALNALSHSRGDLAAQQSKDEADYAMESWKNNIGRLATAAGIQGKITQNDLERWGLVQQWTHDAQRLEEARVGGGIDAVQGATTQIFDRVMKVFDKMSEEDQKIVLQELQALQGVATDQVNSESGSHEKGNAALGNLIKIVNGYGG